VVEGHCLADRVHILISSPPKEQGVSMVLGGSDSFKPPALLVLHDFSKIH